MRSQATRRPSTDHETIFFNIAACSCLFRGKSVVSHNSLHEKRKAMPPSARIGDMHTCPMVNPGPVPHVGGPISLGAPTVIIGGMPAARVGDMCVCVGPPDTIAKGSGTVMIAGMPAARLGDMTAHGGSIVVGCPTVMIGG